jgi:uncharacterized protein
MRAVVRGTLTESLRITGSPPPELSAGQAQHSRQLRRAEFATQSGGANGSQGVASIRSPPVAWGLKPEGSPMPRPIPIAPYLLLSFMIGFANFSSSSAKEKAMMSAAAEQAVDVNQIFTDSAIARLAEAAARGDRRRIAELAPTVDLAAQGDDGVTLLQWALLNKSPEGLEALLEAGANPNQAGLDGDTVVHLAAMANDDRYLKILLAKGADPNIGHGDTGATPLRSALMGERVEQFRELLAAGADPDRADRMGNTPLHVAGQINEPARALDLLKAGADPMARNLQGATFQRYLFMTRVDLLNVETRRDREAVQTWLTEHGITVETTR